MALNTCFAISNLPGNTLFGKSRILRQSTSSHPGIDWILRCLIAMLSSLILYSESRKGSRLSRPIDGTCIGSSTAEHSFQNSSFIFVFSCCPPSQCTPTRLKISLTLYGLLRCFFSLCCLLSVQIFEPCTYHSQTEYFCLAELSITFRTYLDMLNVNYICRATSRNDQGLHHILQNSLSLGAYSEGTRNEGSPESRSTSSGSHTTTIRQNPCYAQQGTESAVFASP
jgi:hypothetical protein